MLVFLKPWRWDRLQALSKQGVIKATIIMPVVGYLILFNASLTNELKLSETYVFAADSFSVARLYLLYLGLAALGAASLWFQLRCPPAIKAHGSAYEFIAKEGPALNDYRITRMTENAIRFEFGAQLTKFEIPTAHAIKMARASERHEMTRSHIVESSGEIAERPFSEWSQDASNRHDALSQLIDQVRRKV